MMGCCGGWGMRIGIIFWIVIIAGIYLTIRSLYKFSKIATLAVKSRVRSISSGILGVALVTVGIGGL